MERFLQYIAKGVSSVLVLVIAFIIFDSLRDLPSQREAPVERDSSSDFENALELAYENRGSWDIDDLKTIADALGYDVLVLSPWVSEYSELEDAACSLGYEIYREDESVYIFPGSPYYHHYSCPDLPAKPAFTPEYAAVSAGYQPCPVCGND